MDTMFPSPNATAEEKEFEAKGHQEEADQSQVKLKQLKLNEARIFAISQVQLVMCVALCVLFIAPIFPVSIFARQAIKDAIEKNLGMTNEEVQLLITVAIVSIVTFTVWITAVIAADCKNWAQSLLIRFGGLLSACIFPAVLVFSIRATARIEAIRSGKPIEYTETMEQNAHLIALCAISFVLHCVISAAATRIWDATATLSIRLKAWRMERKIKKQKRLAEECKQAAEAIRTDQQRREQAYAQEPLQEEKPQEERPPSVSTHTSNGHFKNEIAIEAGRQYSAQSK
jgi:hypothetical protein